MRIWQENDNMLTFVMSLRHKHCRVVKRQTHPPVSGAERMAEILWTNHSVKVRILPLQLNRKPSRKGWLFLCVVGLVLSKLVVQSDAEDITVMSLI